MILRCFGIGGGGVPLVYDVRNEKINCNLKQGKEMKRKKEKCKGDINKGSRTIAPEDNCPQGKLPPHHKVFPVNNRPHSNKLPSKSTTNELRETMHCL